MHMHMHMCMCMCMCMLFPESGRSFPTVNRSSTLVIPRLVREPEARSREADGKISWQNMESIEVLLTQVAKKRKLDPTVKGLDSLISALRRWQREAEGGSRGTGALSEQVSEQGLQELVHGHHKAVNAAVSKLGKGIDKSMASHVELPLERMPGALVAQAVLQKLLQPPSPTHPALSPCHPPLPRPLPRYRCTST